MEDPVTTPNIILIEAFRGPPQIDFQMGDQTLTSVVANHVSFEKAILRIAGSDKTKEVGTLVMYNNQMENGVHHFFTKGDLLILAAKMAEIADSITEPLGTH